MTNTRRGRWCSVGLGLALCAAVAVPLAVSMRAVRAAWNDLHPTREAVRPLRAHPELIGFEETSFFAEDGVALRGWWLASRNGAAVVLTHGWGGSREQLIPQALMLARRGFGLLLYDLRAHGESGGTLCTSGDHERRDVRAAVAFAAAQPGVRPGALGAIGFSIGAIATGDVAVDDRRIAAVVLEAMPASIEDLIHRDYGAHGSLAEFSARWTYRAAGVQVDGVSPGERLGAIAPRPLLLIYGERDREVEADTGRRLARQAQGDVQLWIVPDGEHGRWEEQSRDALDERLVAFFAEALRPGTGRLEGTP